MGKYLGHAIVDRQLRFLSVSSMELFDDTEKEGCQRRWFARYALGFKDAVQLEGINYHEEAARYLTGVLTADAVSPVLRQGLYMLPKPGADLLVEQDVGDTVRFGGVPLIGSLDLFNPRGGEYAPGRLADPPGTVEVIDHKFRDRLANAPSVGALLGGIQMPGYGRWVLSRWPNTPRVRLSHITYSKKLEGAEKTPTTLVTAEQLFARGAQIDTIARSMIDVAKETEANAVPANPTVCMKYGRLCPFAAKCRACPPAIKPKERKVEFSAEMLKAFDGAFEAEKPQPPPPPPPRMVIKDESAKPVPAGRCTVGLLVLTPDKVQRRLLEQRGPGFAFVREGAVDLVLSPDVLVEPIPETVESFEAGRAALHQTVPTDGHQGIIPSDAPKSQMIPGMAFAAEDGSLEADKRKRKGKKPKAESFIRGAAAVVGQTYYVQGPGRNLVLSRDPTGKPFGTDATDTFFPLSDSTELYPPKVELVLGLINPGPLPVVDTSPTTQSERPAQISLVPVAPFVQVSVGYVDPPVSTKTDFEPPANLPNFTSQTQVDELHAKIALLEACVPSAKVLPDSPTADEAVNALLAAAEALTDSLLSRLKGRRIVITIE